MMIPRVRIDSVYWKKSSLLQLAETVADKFYEEFADPAYGKRGENFVWPDTYIGMTGHFTYFQHFKKTEPEAVCIIVGEQVARARCGLSTTVLDSVYRQDPKSWVAAAHHLGEVVVVDEQGKQTLRFSTQTTELTEDEELEALRQREAHLDNLIEKMSKKYP